MTRLLTGAVGCAAVLLVIAALATSPLRGTQAEPLQGGAAVQTLECSPTDLIFHMTLELVAGAPDGPSTSSAGLEDFLAWEYPGWRAPGFRLEADTPAAAQYVYEEAGARLASAYVSHVGGTWHVTEFVACNSLLLGIGSG